MEHPTKKIVTSGLLCGARYEREKKQLGETRSAGGTALVEPNSLSVDYPLDYCGSYLALRTLRPSFHILDKDFVKQEGAAPDDSGSSTPK